MAEDKKRKPELVDDGLDGLTYKVIGLAMAVHNDLGPEHREETYHNAMTQRFVEAGLAAEREPELPIYDEHGNKVNFYAPTIAWSKSCWRNTNRSASAQTVDKTAIVRVHSFIRFSFVDRTRP